MSSAAVGQTPEATDPDVARCADALSRQALTRGFDRKAVADVMADRANARIDRWEAPFSASNRTRVATLISVPLTVVYRDTALAAGSAEARCGFTSGRLLATEIVLRRAPTPAPR